MISAASNPGSGFAERIRTPRRLIEAPIEAMQEDSPRTVAGVLPALQTIPLPRRPPPATKNTPAAAVVAPSLEPDTVAAWSDVMGATVDSAATPEIQSAPATDDLAGSVHAAPTTVTPKQADSTGRKALKGLLRTIGGTPAPGSKTQR
jgi:hypothetical protein